jgi:hypothetical protein
VIATSYCNIGNPVWPEVVCCVEEQCYHRTILIHKVVLWPVSLLKKKI